MNVTHGINLSLQYMFNAPKHDMKFFKADTSGIAQEPHHQSSTRPENRVHSLMHKATVDCLAGPQLTITGQRFQSALKRRTEALPVNDEWIEMDDLFSFLRSLIPYSAIEAMCGVSFLKTFPDFPNDFWNFDGRMPSLLNGCPRWRMPKAWQARDRCLSAIKQWRQLSNEENFDGNDFYWRKWATTRKCKGSAMMASQAQILGFFGRKATFADLKS